MNNCDLKDDFELDGAVAKPETSRTKTSKENHISSCEFDEVNWCELQPFSFRKMEFVMNW